MGNQPRVVVIGGGVIGAAITFYLAKTGVSVTLVDRQEPGSWTTRTSFGWINAFNKKPDHYHRFSRLGIELYDQLEKELGSEAGLSRGGSLHWLPNTSESNNTNSLLKNLRRLRYPVQLITTAQAKKLEPNLKVDSLAGNVIYAPEERWVDGEILCKTLIRHAVGYGADLLAHCEAQNIIVRNGRVHGVLTAKGILSCDIAVIAGGAASLELGASLSYHLPLSRAMGILVITTPAPGIVNRIVYMSKYHIKPTSDGRLAIGCKEMEYLVSGENNTTNPTHWTSQLMKMAQNDFQGLENTYIQELRVSPRPIPSDGLPVIGPIPKIEGAYIAVMHSGVTLAAIVGKTVSEELVEGSPSKLLDFYRADRFHTD